MRIVSAAAAAATALGVMALAGCGGHPKSTTAPSSTVGHGSASTSGITRTRPSRRGLPAGRRGHASAELPRYRTAHATLAQALLP
ncbi:hypothetical protein [Mycobacterium ostraviense]|uniref:hypothetical protein n=1 Tax=Mycobacterium ostraviense TaxID=2738409 RepID=UPI00115652C4|nr:hypothetical protein [Mycobacterium ostraviense]UGT93731.1 hypothetical protein LTS72_11120 [Mycobacterium ostraviense]